MSAPSTSTADVVIIGGGHNGLTAAAYLAQAGLDVVVLERLGEWGGAAVSAFSFEGVEARLSRYSYLVSLLPGDIIRDLRLPITLKKRRYSSYTPEPGTSRGLLIDNHDVSATTASFSELGAAPDASAWTEFYRSTAEVAEVLFPTMTDPLLTAADMKALCDKRLGSDRQWRELLEEPVGRTISSTFSNDLVRGVVLTDALIGTFAPVIDESLQANRCFLYHVIGGGTGDWDVPVGGMGAVSGALLNAARAAGADLISGADVTSLTPDRIVTYRVGDDERTLAAKYVLVNASPTELSHLMKTAGPAVEAEGAQVKVNMVLRRLPRVKDTRITPDQAFGGTFHINETWSQLDAAYLQAERGDVPEVLPCEIYCHSLTDPSILSPELQQAGVQTLTVFGLHTPHRLLKKKNNAQLRDELQASVLASLNSVLAEPIEPLLLEDATGAPCIETKTTQDLEDALRLPGGNIFHGPLDLPFVHDDADLSTPAKRWGVSTDYPGIMVCGSGAIRGGAVSGLGGHNAAMAVLELESS